MPALIAHDRFGKAVYRKLAPKTRLAAKVDTRLFQLGFQGPDVLFYHQPLQKNEVSTLGMQLHLESGKTLFSRICEQLQQTENSALLSYALGVCCHYALDRTCHPYVNTWANEDGRAHQWLESNFDYHILTQHHLLRRRYLCLPEEVNVQVLSSFYGISPKQAADSVRSFRKFARLLDMRYPVKIAEQLMGKRGKYSTLTLPQENHLPCETTQLYTLFEQAIPLGVKLVEELHQVVQENGVDLLDFEENFEGVKE